MKPNALIFILIAGLCLAVIVIAQTNPVSPEANKTAISIPGNNTTGPSENMAGVNSSPGEYVQGELLVRFSPEAFPNMNALNAQSMQAHAMIGAVRIEEYQDIPGLELVRLPPSMSVQDAIAYYQAIPAVRYAETNAIYSIANATGQGKTIQNPSPAANTTNTGDIFVKYNTTAFRTPEDLQVYANATNAAINASVVTDYTLYGMPGLQLIDLVSDMTNAQGIAYYQNVTHVDYAEPNIQYTAVAVNQTTNATPGKN